MKQRGFSMLELVLVLLIIVVIAAISLPDAAKTQRWLNMRAAAERITTTRNAIAANAICVANSQSCPGVAALVPVGTFYQLSTATYTYTYNATGNWWTYVAIPRELNGRSFYVDATGVIRYCDACGGANQTSAVWD